MLKLIAAKFAVFIALSFTAALAQTDSENHSDEFEVTTYGSFVHFKSVLNALFFFKDIARNDSFEFRKALRNHNMDPLYCGVSNVRAFGAELLNC